jgi:hypothetical protein
MNNQLTVSKEHILYVLKDKISTNDNAESVNKIDMVCAVRDLAKVAKEFPARSGSAVISINKGGKTTNIAMIKSDHNIKEAILRKDGQSRAWWFEKIALEHDVRSFKVEKVYSKTNTKQ